MYLTSYHVTMITRHHDRARALARRRARYVVPHRSTALPHHPIFLLLYKTVVMRVTPLTIAG